MKKYLNKINSLFNSNKVFYAFCTFLVLFTILCFGYFIYSGANYFGGDFNIYKEAANAQILSGKSPYTTIADHSFIYPPASVFVLFIFALFDSMFSYIALWFVFLFLTILLYFQFNEGQKFNISNFIYYIVILISGFYAFGQNITSGNLELVTMFLSSLSLVFFIKKKYWVAGLLSGSFAIFKLVPIGFSAGFIFIRKTIKERVILLASALGIFLIYVAINFIFFQSLVLDYLKYGLFGPFGVKYANVHHLIGVFAFFDKIPYLSYALAGVTIIFLIFLFFKYRSIQKNDLKIISFWIVIALILTPRLLDYSFTYTLIPIYLLTKEYNNVRKIFVLGLMALLVSIFVLFFELNFNPLGGGGVHRVCVFGAIAILCAIFVWDKKDSGAVSINA